VAFLKRSTKKEETKVDKEEEKISKLWSSANKE